MNNLYREGYAMGIGNVDEGCPYPESSTARAAWHRGVDAGREDLEILLLADDLSRDLDIDLPAMELRLDDDVDAVAGDDDLELDWDHGRVVRPVEYLEL